MPYWSWFDTRKTSLWSSQNYEIPSPCLGSLSLPVSSASRGLARPEKFSRERNYISPEGYLPDGDSDVVLRTPRRLTYVPVLRLSVGEGEWLFLLVPSFQVSICPSFLSNDRYGGVERATIWSRFPASSCQLFHERALGIRWLIMPR